MTNKKLVYFFGAVAFAGMLTSCSTSGNMASNFGSRKYTKGHFYNTPASADQPASVATANKAVPANTPTVAVANAPVTEHKTIATNNISVAENHQSEPTSVVSSSPSEANMGSVRTQAKHVIPAYASTKNELISLLVAKVGIMNMAKLLGVANSTGMESTPGIQATTKATYGSSKGKMFDFRDHPVKSVLILLLIVIIVGLLIYALATGNATVSASA